MVRQPQWNIYEAVLLLEAYLEMQTGKESKSCTIRKVSQELRNMAIRNGINIDDVYRNENGISYQLQSMDSAYKGYKVYVPATKLFVEAVDIYRHENGKYKALLKEARTMTELIEDNRKKFLSWLSTKRNINDAIVFSDDEIITALDEISDFCVSLTLLNSRIWEVHSKSEIDNAIKIALGGKLFVMNHSQCIPVLDKAVPLFLEFMGNDMENIDERRDVYNHIGSQVERHYIRQDKENFYRWLIDVKHVSEQKSKKIVYAIKYSEEYAQKKISKKCRFLSGEQAVILQTVEALNSNAVFLEIDKRKNHFYTEAITLFLEHLNINENKDELPEKAENNSQINANHKVAQFLINRFAYGFNSSSPIEIMKFRRFFQADFGTECEWTDSEIRDIVLTEGIEYGSKVYVILWGTIKKLSEILGNSCRIGESIFYYDEIYENEGGWLFEERIVSAEMLKIVLEKAFPNYQYHNGYFVTSSNKCREIDALVESIDYVWGDSVLQTFSDIKDKLKFVSLEKVKYALAADKKFIWNSFETYTSLNHFVISEDQLVRIKAVASAACDENGYVSFDELGLDEVASENYELSETAFYESVYSFLKNEFDRNGKVLSRKGHKVDTSEKIISYCRDKQACTMDELEEVMRDTYGEVRYPVVVEAANSAMVRIDVNAFVADSCVSFITDEIDSVLSELVEDDCIGIKEFSSFAMLPDCGYSWNLFLLESFCRRFSKKFRYACITPNSKNAGAIIRRTCDLSYHLLMAKAVARTDIKIEEKAVYDYLVESGLMLKRQYSEMSDLLKEAAKFREGR